MEAYGQEDIRVFTVWVPLLPDDSEPAATKSGQALTDPRVHQFYDAQRSVSLSVSKDLFPKFTEDVLATLPEDHFLRPVLQKAVAATPSLMPMWDILLFYDRGVDWTGNVPQPQRWSKQIAFYQTPRADGATGLFSVDSLTRTPEDSDWFVEVSRQMKLIVGERFED